MILMILNYISIAIQFFVWTKSIGTTKIDITNVVETSTNLVLTTMDNVIPKTYNAVIVLDNSNTDITLSNNLLNIFQDKGL